MSIKENAPCKNPECKLHEDNAVDFCSQQCVSKYASIISKQKSEIKYTEKLERFYKENPIPICPICNINQCYKLPRLWKYSMFCSRKCRAVHETNIRFEKTGFRSVFDNPQVHEKIRQTNIEKYGVEYSSQRAEVIEKRKQTNIEKYGETTPLKLNSVKEKIKQTNLEKYGDTSAMRNESVKNKIRETMKEKYGAEHALQVPKFIKKRDDTCIERYGTTNHMLVEEIRDKQKETMIEKYGVEHLSQLDWWHEKRNETNIKKYGGVYPSYVNYTDLGKHLMSDEGFNDLVELNKKQSVTQIANENGMSPSALLQRFKANNMTPKRHYTSTFQLEIKDFIESLICENINVNDRTIISPLEIDIVYNNLLIECNGVFWHNESSGKDKNYHLNKTNLCKEKGFDLLHIWDYEWEDSKDIIKSIIKNKLNLATKIYARNTKIEIISKDDEKLFLETNHLQGYIKSDICYGLYYDNKLVSVMTFGKSRFNKKIEYELLRLSTILDHVVIGGANKLFKQFIKDHNPISIISYCSIDKFNGKVYENIGMTYSHDSKPSYHYTKDGYVYNRIKFQKHKLNNILEKFDNNLTEYENMFANGWHRFWDCGNKVYTWKKEGL